ncbi:O-antigen ligase family protein [Tellurirhabdus rosea]|uniref:O-antigen ligase family protein n=1 Tax=Tellurirhabdus rosea TaxID=2674997 RepID=UPI00225A2AA1|nr:O-antigen ligase family protein [Tellurirhabdus rosea]
MKLFFFTSLISSLTVSNFDLSIAVLSDLIFYYVYYRVLLVVIKSNKIDLIPKTLFFVLIVSVFIQTMQFLGYEQFNIYTSEKLNQNTGLEYEGIDVVIRYWGPFGNALTFSSYLAISGVFLFIYYRNSQGKGSKFISYLSLLISLYSVVLTAGRTALVSILVSLLIYIFIKRKSQKNLIAIILFSLAVTLTIGFDKIEGLSDLGVVNRFTNLSEDGNFRWKLWLDGFKLFLNNLLFGAGPGNLNLELANYADSSMFMDVQVRNFPWGHVENAYLTVLYTFGLLGSIFFFFIIFKPFQYCIKSLDINSQGPLQSIKYSMICTWITIFINMVTNPIFVCENRMTAFLLFFIAISECINNSFHSIKEKSLKTSPYTINQFPS